MSQTEQALRWVVNAGIGRTPENFIEDFEPIGAMLLQDLQTSGRVHIDDGLMCLTKPLDVLLKELP